MRNVFENEVQCQSSSNWSVIIIVKAISSCYLGVFDPDSCCVAGDELSFHLSSYLSIHPSISYHTIIHSLEMNIILLMSAS